MELKNGVGMIIMGFLTILIGAVLISPLGDDIEGVKTASVNVSNESVTTSSGTGTTANDELIAIDQCRNASMVYIPVGAQCNATLASGTISIQESNFSDGVAYINYRYTPDTYVRDGTARTLLDTSLIFFAIAIMLIGVAMTVKGFKDVM